MCFVNKSFIIRLHCNTGGYQNPYGGSYSNNGGYGNSQYGNQLGYTNGLGGPTGGYGNNLGGSTEQYGLRGFSNGLGSLTGEWLPSPYGGLYNNNDGYGSVQYINQLG